MRVVLPLFFERSETDCSVQLKDQGNVHKLDEESDEPHHKESQTRLHCDLGELCGRNANQTITIMKSSQA